MSITVPCNGIIWLNIFFYWLHEIIFTSQAHNTWTLKSRRRTLVFGFCLDFTFRACLFHCHLRYTYLLLKPLAIVSIFNRNWYYDRLSMRLPHNIVFLCTYTRVQWKWKSLEIEKLLIRNYYRSCIFQSKTNIIIFKKNKCKLLFKNVFRRFKTVMLLI